MNKLLPFLIILYTLPALVNAQISEKNLGVISEIVMSSECLAKPNYNLFFESNVNTKEPERSAYWYKLAFSKDCFIKLTLVPNNEKDRYNLSLYSTKRNEYFCDEHEKIEDIEELVTFNDSHQPETFRESMFYSKVIEVFDNEAIYVIINHLNGMDSGHVLEIQTCDDYSYILKVNKPESILNTTTLDTQSLASIIPKKLCQPNDSSYLGYISFNNNKIMVNNYTNNKIDSLNSMYTASLSAFQDKIKEPSQVATDTLQYTTLRSPGQASILSDKTNEQPKVAGIFKIIHKVPDAKEKNYRLDDAYASYLQTPEVTSTSDKKSTKTVKGPRTKRTARTISKVISANFIIVNAETGIVLKQPAFKLLKEPGLRPLQYVYNDSIGIFSAEIEAEGAYRIECDLIGYKNYAQQLELKNKIEIDSTANYIIPLNPLKAGDKFVIPNIYFYPNAPAFKEESFEELNKLAKYMNNSNMNILIAGHTNGNKHISKDKRQTDETLTFSGSAKKLSKKRAEGVRDFLVKSGIEKSRIMVKGYGGKKPIIQEPKNRKEGEKNMRVEIFITE